MKLDINDIDKPSRDLIKEFLTQVGYDDIFDSLNQFQEWDLRANKNGKKYSFELKQRNINHDTYNDMIIEKYKYETNLKNLENKIFDYCFIVYVFNDTIITITNIKKPIIREFKAWAKQTTHFKNKKWVLKDFVSFEQAIKIKFSKNNDKFTFKKI